jgi:hypothetical protein
VIQARSSPAVGLLLAYFRFLPFFLPLGFFAADAAGLAIFLCPLEKIDSQLSEYFLVAPTRTIDTVFLPFNCERFGPSLSAGCAAFLFS